jgi:succinyl-diaminopimelate desuccinylase
MDRHSMKHVIWELAQRESSELIRLCSELIRVPSENPPAQMGPIVELLRGFFEKEGIAYAVVGPDKEHPSIVATYGKGSALLLNGHSDVVPVGDRSQWRFDPFGGEVTEKQIRGRGASDMKCGLGGALFAMRLIARQKLPIEGKIVLHIVPDEETGGMYGTRWLVENGFADDAVGCIVAEPTSRSNCEVGQKGSVRIRLKVRGTSAHGSIGNYVGENAIRRTAAILARLEDLRTMTGRFTESQAQVLLNSKRIAEEGLKAPHVGDVIDHVTVNIGTIRGGTKINMVADYCESEIDIRVPIGLPTQQVKERFLALARQEKTGGIECDITSNEANYTDDAEPLVRALVQNAEEVWHHPVVPAYQWASSDARYYREKGIPTLQYGPANLRGIHSYNEDVDIEDVINSAKIYLGTIIDLLCSADAR